MVRIGQGEERGWSYQTYYMGSMDNTKWLGTMQALRTRVGLPGYRIEDVRYNRADQTITIFGSR